MEEHILEKRIAGSPLTRFLQELFGNSAQFPIANMVFELLREGPRRVPRAAQAGTVRLVAAKGRQLPIEACPLFH